MAIRVSISCHRFLDPGRSDPTLFDPLKAGIPDLQVQLVPRHTEVLENGIIWVRYAVKEL